MTRRRALTLGRLVDRYISQLGAAGKAERTVDHYDRVLGYMLRGLGQHATELDPADISEDDLLDVLGKWRHLAPNTRANRRVVLGQFWSWAAKRYDFDDPALELVRPKKNTGVRRRLSIDDVHRILRAPATDRDRFVVWMLAMTALRRAELISIRWRDVDTTQRVIRVKGKGDKSREVPIPVPLAALLADTRARLSEHGHADPLHFVCCRRYSYQTGREGIRAERIEPTVPMGNTTPARILHRVAAAAGISDAEHVGPHDLRRAYALAFLTANPGDIYRLQAVLGHADISTTRIYLPAADFGRTIEAVDRIGFAGPVELELVTDRKPPRDLDVVPPANSLKERAKGLEPSLDPSGEAAPEAVEPSEAPCDTASDASAGRGGEEA